ncbi:hypothetical protein CK3_23330 [butyrate-producing bacterium SS3/4]|nr:hypothetical protein CK3_23330 [butyrate-producing bacterium SS3/4]
MKAKKNIPGVTPNGSTTPMMIGRSA